MKKEKVIYFIIAVHVFVLYKFKYFFTGSQK